MRSGFCVLIPMLLLSGCAVSAATKLVTAPIRVASKAVDLATTSQSDEKRGRKMRERDDKIGKLLRKRDRYARDCPESSTACIRAQGIEAEIQEERGRPL
jgi:hypothetical protein